MFFDFKISHRVTSSVMFTNTCMCNYLFACYKFVELKLEFTKVQCPGQGSNAHHLIPLGHHVSGRLNIITSQFKESDQYDLF